VGVISSIHAPDLRTSGIPLSAEAFAGVVRGGAFVSQGMPVFGELTDEQLIDLRQYIRSEAQKLRASKTTYGENNRK
jgi:quinohemoprotein ethanol dehydrogenase